MHTTIYLELSYEFEVKAPAKEVFKVLSDVPTSASFYPGVDQLVDEGNAIYRWEMEPIGVSHIQLQTVYASKYFSDPANLSVEWVPIKDEGNAQVAGSWSITKNKKSTTVLLQVRCAVDVPLPALMKPVIEPLVEFEFEHMTEKYIHNLIERFGGEV